MIDSQILRRLAAFDTPTICNVIELFDIRPRNSGYMDSRIRCNFPELPVMVGFAATATFRSDAPPKGSAIYDHLRRQLDQFTELPGPAVVVIQDLDDPPVAAVFGEVMCSIYRAFGAAGLVTSGAGRDLQQVRDIRFPVFTSATICSHAYCHLGDVGPPVRVGGRTVETGELLHGDVNGVTQIPLDIASEIPDAAAEFVAAERIILDYVQSSAEMKTSLLAERQAEYGERIRQLRQRIGGQ